MRPHVHISVLSGLFTVLEFLLAWIPIKIVASRFEGRTPLASAVLHVL